MASLFIKVSNPASEYILLFSHGNASDLGLMIDTLIGIPLNNKIWRITSILTCSRTSTPATGRAAVRPQTST